MLEKKINHVLVICDWLFFLITFCNGGILAKFCQAHSLCACLLMVSCLSSLLHKPLYIHVNGRLEENERSLD